MSDDLNNITHACKYLLNNNANIEVQSYLDSRLSREVQNIFEFGYYPSINDLSLLTNLVSKEVLRKNQLIFSKQIEDSLFPRLIDFSYFENYPLVLPFKDQYGIVKGIVARTLFTETVRNAKQISKYKNTKTFHKSKYLFGLYENKKFIEQSSSVYLVEGQFDVIKAYECGIKNVVATGSCSLSNTQFALIKRYTNNILILFDNDKAGKKGREKIIERYSEYANIENVFVPEKFKDIDDYLCTLNGKEPEIIMKT